MSIDAALVTHPTYRLAYAAAVNQISRIFPVVAFTEMPAQPIAITPWDTNAPIRSVREPSLVVHFGMEQFGKPRLVSANASDWHVYLDTPCDPPRDDFNPVLAILTAAYACSRATKLLLNDAVEGAKCWRPFSILDFDSGTVEFDWSAPIAIDRTTLAGVGAIGSAFLCTALAHSQLVGELVIVDEDVIDKTNLGRYVLFSAHDVGQKKVIAAERRLRSLKPGLTINPVDLRLQTYSKEQSAKDQHFKIQRLVSAPDRRDTRRSFQSELPREIIDASTGPNQIVIHRNGYEREWACLECIYPRIEIEDAHYEHVAYKLGIPLQRVKSGELIDVSDAEAIHSIYPSLAVDDLLGRAFDSVFRELCSAGELRVEDRVVLAPMPFVSAAAGAYLYLEMIKSIKHGIFASFRRYNYVQMNPFFPPNPSFAEMRPSREGCTCQSAVYRHAFERLWSE
ncbi:MAG TPA: ThiF family adenylyltransferase [Candidatus Sulfotelmatobacter sp.]|nr:ThiF family adenylyltransferase [Candidatus Sulfotelmatobacter sp.]